MAIIADCRQPDADYTAQRVDGTIRSNAFPTPPIAWGWIADDIEGVWEIDGLEPPYILMGGPLHPEGSYIEPNRGQIWPRIG